MPDVTPNPCGIRLAIHPRANSFSDRWIGHSRERGIPVETISGYDSNLAARLSGFDAFLWHFDQDDPRDMLMARTALEAAEAAGLTVFPNHATRWHFNDKIGQKYLLESLGAPLVPTLVFYDRAEALAWLRSASYPLVGKLRSGAGSANVRLLRDYSQASAYCERLFGRGYVPVPGYFDDAATKFASIRQSREFRAKLRRMPRAVLRRLLARRQSQVERGYLLVQQFVPGNLFDTRITVVGDRAWGFTRNVRKNDFRASGSRNIDYNVERINPECVRIAFTVARQLKMQSVAFDFVTAAERRPLIVEISFGYASLPVYSAAGQWTPDLEWIPGHRHAEDFILDNLVSSLVARAGAERAV